MKEDHSQESRDIFPERSTPQLIGMGAGLGLIVGGALTMFIDDVLPAVLLGVVLGALAGYFYALRKARRHKISVEERSDE
ncbi:MAG: hypothetical protein JW750_12665 [Anaerolineaceae bacterium]|nr:hypothetical protein [Anaerolineaceae bacterium]